MVAGYLEGNPVGTILDSGAGVSIVGRRFVDLYRRTFGYPPPMDPITLTVTGVNSAASLAASAVTSFMLSFGPRTASHKVSAVVVPGWDGEVLLGWHTLRTLGITFILNEEGIPERVNFTRIGVECELMEPCSVEAIRETRTVVQTVVAQMGEEWILHLGGSPSGKPQGPGGEDPDPWANARESTKREANKATPRGHPRLLDPHGGRKGSRIRRYGNLMPNHFQVVETEGSTGGLSRGSDGGAIRDEAPRRLEPKSSSPRPKASSHFWHGKKSRNPRMAGPSRRKAWRDSPSVGGPNRIFWSDATRGEQ